MVRFAGWVLCVVGPLVLAGVAHAAPGDHIRVGDAVITPSLAAGFEYRTNLYRVEADPVGGLGMRVIPSLTISLKGPDASLQVDGRYELKKYFGADLVALDRFDNFDVGAAITALDQQVVGFKLDESAGLLNNPVEALTSEDPYSTQLSNDLEGTIELRPGSALTIGLGGRWEFDDYRVPTGAQADGTRPFNRKNTYGPVLHSRWEFFPRTAFALDASYLFVRWQDNLLSTPDESGQVGSVLAIPNAELGIRGRIAPPLVLVLMAGYGDARYSEDSVTDAVAGTEPGADSSSGSFAVDLSGIDHLLLDAQLKYIFGVGQKATVGYSRDFQDVYFTNYVAFDYIYARLNNRIGGRVGTDAEFGARFEGYEGEITRQDIRLAAKGDISVQASDWAKISTGLWWNQRASTDDLVEYDDFNVHLTGTFTY